MKNLLLNLIIGLFCLSIIIIIVITSTKNLTSNETTLISVLLTILSIVVTWLVSQYFSNLSHKQAIEEVRTEHLNNLRTYALNAAEKVDNLSNELSKLSLYLQSELENDNETFEEASLSKTERIESAIHIINTLKSVNDTSLSDWKGVIGEELEEREEEKEERENKLLLLTERLDQLSNERSNLISEKEFLKLKNQINLLLNSVNLPLLKRKLKSTKVKVEKPCPNCKEPIAYTQRTNEKSFKTVNCPKCKKRFSSRYSIEKNFYFVEEELLDESYTCPWCSDKQEIKFSNLPLVSDVIICSNCKSRVKISRNTNNSLAVKRFGNPVSKAVEDISDELLSKIAECLPQQPWPTGIHKIVAEKLGISNGVVTNAINILIQ